MFVKGLLVLLQKIKKKVAYPYLGRYICSIYHSSIPNDRAVVHLSSQYLHRLLQCVLLAPRPGMSVSFVFLYSVLLIS